MAGKDAPAQLNHDLAEKLVPGTLVAAAMATEEVRTKAFLAMFMVVIIKWKTTYI